jgi:hypothetical protein
MRRFFPAKLTPPRSGLDIYRLIKANRLEDHSFRVDDLDPVVADQMALRHRVRGQRPGARFGIGSSGLEIRELLALVIKSIGVVVNVEEVSRHRCRYP